MRLFTLLPGLPVALPLIMAALLAALRKWIDRTVADAIAITGALLTLAVSSMLLMQALHATHVYWFGNWYPRGTMALGICFVVDATGAGLATLAGLLVTLALLFSWKHVDCGAKHYQPLMLIFLAAMGGFALTGDLFNLFVFFELMSTAAFALCGLKTQEPAPLQGSFNFAVTNTVAAFLGLTGIALLYAMTGALNMAQVGFLIGSRHDPLVLFAFTLLLCCFLVKAAIVPFQFWLADAHAVAPTPVCVLFSGLMVELGLYAVVRLHSVVFQQALAGHIAQLQSILLTLAFLTVVVGSVMCYAEHHVKRTLAFSTISHAGLMLAAFALQGRAAIAAFLVYLLAHAFVKSGLFFVSGILLHRFRTISERAMFARGRGMWAIGALWILGAMGLAAAPGFSTMLGEAAVSSAAHGAGVRGVWLLYLLAGALTSAAVLRIGLHTFAGWGTLPLTDEAAEVDELPETDEAPRSHWYHWGPAAFCIFAAIMLTAAPAWQTAIRSAAGRVGIQQAYVQTVYTDQLPTLEPASAWNEEIRPAALHGSIALLAGLAIACSSVFRKRLPASLRVGPFLEQRLTLLRQLQSGHVGDYVMWLTVGFAGVGAAIMLLMRS